MHRFSLTLALVVIITAPAAGVAPQYAAAQPAPEASTPTYGANVQVAEGTPAPPLTTAGAWMLTDITSGKILASSNATEKHLPASTLKVLTALSLLPEVDLNATHLATHAEAGIEGSKAGIKENSLYHVEDLMHGLLLDSGNDTAAALANEVGGLPQATALMNAKLTELGASDSYAANTSGLDADGQVTTAFDMTLIARAALQEPTIQEIMATRTYDFPGEGTTFGPDRETFQIGNHNKLVWNYDGATGGKTGYTDKARHTFMASAERGDHHLVVTILRAEGRTWKMAAPLLDWGFSVAGTTPGIGQLPPVEVVSTPEPHTTETDDSPGQTLAAGQANTTNLPASNTTGQFIIAGLLVGGAVLAGAFVARGTSARRRRLYGPR